MKYFYITEKNLLAYVAHWSVLLSPYTVPDDLVAVLEELHKRAFSYFQDGMTNCPMWRVTEELMVAFLRKEFLTIPQVLKWNQAKSNPAITLVIVSNFSETKPDDDFIDLDALISNILRGLFKEAARDEESNIRIDASIIADRADL